MVKVSLIVMLVLTLVIGFGLRWREARQPQVAAARRRGLLARSKAGLDRWVTAAALASALSIALVGGLHWLRIWLGHG
ncbi:hypothetical protein ACFOD4_04385 [Pseudoroseomonas globiformis]|uniref:Uncharacterized protein n=1 Tax=Teichococcus globiformis TaxID=2307229 RepID=A0ABV7FVS7_9PROT